MVVPFFLENHSWSCCKAERFSEISTIVTCLASVIWIGNIIYFTKYFNMWVTILVTGMEGNILKWKLPIRYHVAFIPASKKSMLGFCIYKHNLIHLLDPCWIMNIKSDNDITSQILLRVPGSYPVELIRINTVIWPFPRKFVIWTSVSCCFKHLVSYP